MSTSRNLTSMEDLDDNEYDSDADIELNEEYFVEFDDSNDEQAYILECNALIRKYKKYLRIVNELLSNKYLSEFNFKKFSRKKQKYEKTILFLETLIRKSSGKKPLGANKKIKKKKKISKKKSKKLKKNK